MSKWYCLFLCLLLANPLWIPTAHAVEAARQKSLGPGKKTTPGKPTPRAEPSSRIGYLVMDLESGRVLESSLEQETFIPASVSKVPATLAALHILGSNHRFTTTVQSGGSVVNGVLQGDLVLVGGGDPSFDVAGAMDLILQLRLKGIQRIQGQFLYDESALQPDLNICNEQNEEESYNQGISALSMEFNRVQIHWSMAPNGQLTTRFTPDLGHIGVTLGPSSRAGPSLSYLGGEKVEQWRLNPRGTRSGWDWVPIKKPARFTALFFRELSRETGLELPPPQPGPAPPKAVTLASHASPPLSDLVDPTLEHSNNLWTELIGMAAASRLTGQPQSASGAGKVLGEWLAKKMPQVDWNGFHLANSSGLTANSRISPRQMVEILVFANASLAGERAFPSMLPISGWKGTLSGRFNGPSTFRVWAKTGTILFGKSLAGYLFTQQNHRLVFALFASDIEQRKAFDAKLGRHLGEDIGRGRVWNSQASAHISALVEKWLRTY